MHVSLLFTAIALAGQLNGNGDDHRYRNLGPPPVTPSAPVDIVPGTQRGASNIPPLVTPQTPFTQPSSSALPSGNLGFDNGATTPLSNTLPSNVASSSPLKPSEILHSMLEKPRREKLAGTPWTLAGAVQGAQTRGEQTRRVEAYWELVASVARYNNALQDVVHLQTLQASIRQPGSQWQQERQTLEARVQVARHSAKVAQHRLQQMLGRSTNDALPLPSDLPHCGEYDTRFNEIFARQTSNRAGHLNELLALNYQALLSEAESVTLANQWLQTVSQTRNPNTDGRGLLKALELLTLRRDAFVEGVRDYNINIVRYAEISTPGEVSTGRLVAMLISSGSKQQQKWSPPGIQRTSAEVAIESQPRTFSQGNQGLTQRATAPQRGVEHSILTPPGSASR